MDKKFKFKLDKDKIKLQLEKLGEKFVRQKKHGKELLLVLMIFMIVGIGIAVNNNYLNNSENTNDLSQEQNESPIPNPVIDYDGQDSIFEEEANFSLDYSDLAEESRNGESAFEDDSISSDNELDVFTEPLKPVHEISDETKGISLIKPVSGNVIQESGWYYHSLLEDWRYQSGIAFDGSNGDIVMASASGEVVDVKEDDYKGIMVLIEHEEGWLTEYGHLQRASVTVGNHVSKGQEIGRLGNTGLTSQPALYFSLQNGEESVTPLDFFE